MSNADSVGPNPALKHLEILVGDWEMELSNADFLPNRSDTVVGQMSIEWIEYGAFLVMRMGEKPPNRADAVWLFSRDDSSPNYKALYYDQRKVSRVYEMSFSDNTWKMWRETRGFSQRYEGLLSKNGKTITGKWEKSNDGKTWTHDFDVTYRRK